MKLNIRSRHVDISPAIKEYAEKKLSKMDRFFSNIQEIVVEFDISKSSNENERQFAAATVWASGTILRAQETSESLYASVDAIFEKLEKQLKKYNEKLKDRKGGSGKQLFIDSAKLKEKAEESAKNKRSHVHTREYRPKPLTPEDAASIVISEHLDFLMFRNANTEEINVIYPTNSGEFELMEP